MTLQYLSGELSIRLAQLHAAVGVHQQRDVAVLRRQAEDLPVSELPGIAARALRLSDDVCWDCLRCGDVAVFSGVAAAAAELVEFSAGAGWLADEEPRA